MSWQPASSQMVQQPKQSQHDGVTAAQSRMHSSVCAGQSRVASKLGSIAAQLSAPSRQQVCQAQSSGGAPLLPSKKQSCHFGSRLSPGMSVAKLPSSSSRFEVHSGSKLSMRSSTSLSRQ